MELELSPDFGLTFGFQVPEPKRITMNTTPSNSNYQPGLENQAPKNELATKSHYRRRVFDSILCIQYLGQSYQAFIQSSKMDDQDHTSASESERENSNPTGGGEKVSDPNGIKPDENSPRPEDEKEVDPNKEIPEENNYLVDEEGSIIKEPTREIDDPYLPGHADENIFPGKQDELPDPKQNTETDF